MSRYIFSIQGLNLFRHTRALSTIAKLHFVRLGDNTLVFVVSGRYKRAVEQYLAKTTTKYITTRLSVFEKISVKRFGYLIALAVCIIVAIVGSFFVYDISVTGYDAVAVATLLQERDINYLGYRGSIDTHSIQDILFSSLDISVADVKVIGSKLYISIKQVLAEGDILDEHTPTPLVSQYDCVITRIVASSGTAEVRVGEAVSKGTTLISPYTLVGDSRREVDTIGEVYGKIYLKESVCIPRTIIKYVDSGNTYNTQTISIFCREGKTTCEYKMYRRETSYKRLYGILPLYKVNITYIEQVPTEVYNVDYDNISTTTLASSLALIQRGEEIGAVTDSWLNIKEMENYKIVDICVEVETVVASNIN